ncbi:hypothetical protein [Clostridium butyricum]|uniref:hypothetical protein n=1 Tax=Clostridium butyricum TaxID=1492 RepID=UPI0022E7A692|nr:hypothetical protein [Clostridium butyricum]
MDIKIGDYQIVSDERQFVVKATKKVTDEKSENYGKDYMQNIAYCTSLDSALKFVPHQVLKSNNEISIIVDKLKQIEADIKVLPKHIKIAKEIDKSKVLIDEAEYEELKERDNILSRLEGAGVDNWEGYSYAFEDEE